MMNEAAQLEGSALSFFSLAIWQGFVPNKFTAVPKVHPTGFKVKKSCKDIPSSSLVISFVPNPH